MKVYFGQIYVQQGAEFPFTCEFQEFLSREVTSAVVASTQFGVEFGEDFSLIFRISAKHDLNEIEVRGPTEFRADRTVEFTVFLPFDRVIQSEDPRRACLTLLFRAVYKVLTSLHIAIEGLEARQDFIINHVCSSGEMFISEEEQSARAARLGANVGAPLWHATPRTE